MKRLFDIVLVSIVLALISPLLFIVAVLIKSTSAGPVIFAQTRVGKNERPFKCLKFRTMIVGSPSVATHEAARNWVTPVGKLLRRSKVDELPQLLNVLLGEMSLVGPRPCLPQQQELILERRRLGVFQVLPGITGEAQLSGIDMSTPHRLASVDAEYISSRTLWKDLRILARTISGKGAGDAL